METTSVELSAEIGATEPIGFAIVGSAIGGLIVQALHWSREKRARKATHARWRSHLVSDVLHNVKTIHMVLNEAGEKDVLNRYRDSQLASMLAGNDYARAGFDNGTLHLDGWLFLKDQFLQTCDDAEEAILFATIFQRFLDALPNDSSFRGAGYRGYLGRPRIVMKDGYARKGVPANVMDNFGSLRSLAQPIGLVIQYGTEEQAVEAQRLAGEGRETSGWFSPTPERDWLPSQHGAEPLSPIRVNVSIGPTRAKPTDAEDPGSVSKTSP